MSWKFIQLKPLKPFFFGKEVNFKNTNYVKSEYFPQQTQLLGALRAYLMESTSLLQMHKTAKFCSYDKRDDAKKLVGFAKSSDFSSNDNLGKIKFLSPMFVVKSHNDCITDALFEIPSDVVKKECSYKQVIPKKINNIVSDKQTVFLQDYDVKNGFVSGFGDKDFWEKYRNHDSHDYIYSHDKIFQVYDQVGIEIDENKQTVEGKYYTKRSYNLKNGFLFGFLLNIEDDEKLKDGIITLGGENSVFELKVMDIPQSIDNHPVIESFCDDLQKNGTKIVLLSESYLEHSIDKDAYYQIVTRKIPFRMMETNNKEQTTKKSEEKLLVPKGSVYYFDTPNSLPEAKGAYKKMGFNRYLILN